MESPASSGWLKIGAIAGVSVIAGGLVALWLQRSTIQKLRLAAETESNPDFGISGADLADEI